LESALKLKSIILLIFFVLSCGKNSDQTIETSAEFKSSKDSPQSPSMSAERGMEEVASSPAGELDQITRDRKSENFLGKVFAPVGDNSGRLLEYNIQLSYQCTDLVKTRKELLDFISKFGYLESSSAVNSSSPFMTARIHITSAKLYEALQELDKLGNLLSEDIGTTDHTEGMAWQKRKTTREKLRQQRRNTSNSQITAGARNWQQVEEAISESEDQLDLAEHETWKINDRVKWATVSVSFTTPIPADAIQIPAYRNAFVGLLNLFLELSYYLIWILPLLILGGISFYFFRRILVNFRKKDI